MPKSCGVTLKVMWYIDDYFTKINIQNSCGHVTLWKIVLVVVIVDAFWVKWINFSDPTCPLEYITKACSVLIICY